MQIETIIVQNADKWVMMHLVLTSFFWLENLKKGLNVDRISLKKIYEWTNGTFIFVLLNNLFKKVGVDLMF